MYITTINGKTRRFNSLWTCTRMARMHGPEGVKVVYSRLTNRYYTV